MIQYSINGAAIEVNGDQLAEAPWARQTDEEISFDLTNGPTHTLNYKMLWQFAKVGMVLPKKFVLPVGSAGDNNVIYGEISGTKLDRVVARRSGPIWADVQLVFVPVAFGEKGASDLNLRPRRCVWQSQPTTVTKHKTVYVKHTSTYQSGSGGESYAYAYYKIFDVEMRGVGGSASYTEYYNRAGVCGAAVDMPGPSGAGARYTIGTGSSISDDGLTKVTSYGYNAASWTEVSRRAVGESLAVPDGGEVES